MNQDEKIAIKISYIIGVPIGFLVTLITAYLPLMATGESIFYILLGPRLIYSIVIFLLAFVITLWYAAKNSVYNIKHQSLLKTSYNYSLHVNAVCWSIFTFSLLVLNPDQINGFMILLPLILFLSSTFLSTFTIGLLICTTVKKKLIAIEF